MRFVQIAPLLASLTVGPAAAQMQLQGAVPPGVSSAGPSGARRSLPAVRAPAIESVVGRDLMQNGSDGSMRIERNGSGLRLSRLVLSGFRTDSAGDRCRLELFEGVGLKSAGSVQGLSRYDVDLPMCGFTLDVLEGAVFARGKACVIEAAACNIDPAGVWGPPGSSIRADHIGRIERERRSAEERARAYFRALMASTQDKERVKRIAADQAGFSSRRSEACDAYSRESVHGFCAARLTEARALALKAELDAAPPAQAPRRGRPVRPSSR